MRRIYLIPLALLCLCCVDENTTLTLRVENQLQQDLKLVFYTPPEIADSSIINLTANGKYENGRNDKGASENYPLALHRIPPFPIADSVKISFNDSVWVMHVMRESGMTDTLQHAIIYFSENRNIFNTDSYIKGKVSDNNFIGRYIIGQEDLDYAILLNE